MSVFVVGEEARAFDALEKAVQDLHFDLRIPALETLAALRERFEQAVRDSELDFQDARKAREQVEDLETKIAGLEDDIDEAREYIHQFCTVALKCESKAVNIDKDIDDALEAVRSAIAFEELWTEPLEKADIEEPSDLSKVDPDGAMFLDELGAQLQTDDPVLGLKLKLGRSAPGEPAIIPNAWAMSPAQLAYELANL